jgi:hypothetical protein
MMQLQPIAGEALLSRSLLPVTLLLYLALAHSNWAVGGLAKAAIVLWRGRQPPLGGQCYLLDVRHACRGGIAAKEVRHGLWGTAIVIARLLWL